MYSRFAMPVLAIAAAFALSGCVDNSAPSLGNASSNPGTVGGVDAAAVGLLPASIKSAGRLIVGIDPTYAPNEYKDDAGKPIGWEVDLANAMAQKLGLKADYQIANFDTIIPSITGGSYDIGLSSFTDTVEREKAVDFVNYYNAGIQWVKQIGKHVDPANACGLTVAVWTSSFEETDELPAKSKACTDAGKPAITILKFDTQQAATNAVVLGRADAMSADSPISLYAAAQLKAKIDVAGGAFEVAPYGIAAKKGSPLAKALQTVLQSMVSDGSYKKILDKWGVASGGSTAIMINAAAKG